MKRLAFVFLLSVFSFSAVSQSKTQKSEMPYSGAPCTASGGIAPSQPQIVSFKRFDADLRSALKRNDSAALSFLVSYPLRVNTAKGELLIPDAQSLAGHYTEIFSSSVRDRILATSSDDYICRYDEGVGYADGVVWASTDDHKFTLIAVNSPGTPPTSKTAALVYTCETKTHRISIEGMEGNEFRYRSWNKPKPLSGTPDVDLLHGKLEFEGTGVCAYPLYTFTTNNVVYEVQGAMGCGDGSEPAKATGHLSVSIDGKQVTDTYCF